jgi:hypothetical protein
MDLGLVKINKEFTAYLIVTVEKPRFEGRETLSEGLEALQDRTAVHIMPAFIFGINLQERRYMDLNTGQPVLPRLYG